MAVRGDLRPALDQLGGRADEEGGEASGRACAVHLEQGRGGIGGVMEECEGAVVGYEEEGIEGAVAEEWCCCAYARGCGISARTDDTRCLRLVSRP